MNVKQCLCCEQYKTENDFYASWSHWCNKCIKNRKLKKEIEEFEDYGTTNYYVIFNQM